MLKFRTLNADEVELRVSQAGRTKDGRVWAQYLIYKDARVDQRILDETVGADRWQKTYEVIDGNLYCTVSIWNEELKTWVGKQDVGVESYTEKEKGQASDAFKRACFNWGIGRELYTAPKDLYIDLQDGEWGEKDGKIIPRNRLFSVSEMVVEDGKITKLVVIDGNLNIRYPKAARKSAPATRKATAPAQKKPAVQTANVERVHPTESQLVSMAKRIAAGENLTDKIQVTFLMGQQEWMHLDDLVKQYQSNQ